jgi:hypothetical protein
MKRAEGFLWLRKEGMREMEIGREGISFGFHARIYNIHVHYFTPSVSDAVTPFYMRTAHPVVIIGYTISSFLFLLLIEMSLRIPILLLLLILCNKLPLQLRRRGAIMTKLHAELALTLRTGPQLTAESKHAV